ncbi:MAG TPA: septation protein SepH [Nocardioides sp.]|nr:septation protein SepH [Nocardioides sp.]
MSHLTLAGLSDDGKRLLLVSDKGVEFTLDIDARLRAALRGDHARLGHLEIRMDSALRPRDIQARIRAGDTPEAVAQAAQTTVDRIMAFAAPVLAERQHVAERAQRSSVRRKPGESASGARTLGDAVAGHLRSLNVDPETVVWDARRREDGRWTLTGDFASGKRQGSANFIYDPPGNYVTVENDDARWLLGEQVAAAQRPARDDLKQARGRRLSAVPHEELPLGDDAIELVSEESGSLGAEQPVEAYLDDERPTRETPAVEEPPVEPEPAPEPAAREEPPTEEEPPADEEPPARKPAKRKGRASVPSWDEIMFGGGKND